MPEAQYPTRALAAASAVGWGAGGMTGRPSSGTGSRRRCRRGAGQGEWSEVVDARRRRGRLRGRGARPAWCCTRVAVTPSTATTTPLGPFVQRDSSPSHCDKSARRATSGATAPMLSDVRAVLTRYSLMVMLRMRARSRQAFTLSSMAVMCSRQHRGVAVRVEEQHGVGDVSRRGPRLLDDAVDLGRPVGERTHHLVADVAAPRLELARKRRLRAVPSLDPRRVVEALGPVDERHGEDAGRPLAVGPVPGPGVRGRAVVLVERLDHEVAGAREPHVATIGSSRGARRS